MTKPWDPGNASQLSASFHTECVQVIVTHLGSPNRLEPAKKGDPRVVVERRKLALWHRKAHARLGRWRTRSHYLVLGVRRNLCFDHFGHWPGPSPRRLGA